MNDDVSPSYLFGQELFLLVEGLIYNDMINATPSLLSLCENDNIATQFEKTLSLLHETPYHHTGYDLEAIARNILTKETSLHLANYHLDISTSGFTGAFKHVLNQIVTPQRSKVMFASPNWKFDKIIDQLEYAQSEPLFALNYDILLEKFNDRVDNTVAAIVLVDPSNPFGAMMTASQVNEFELIAEKYGVIPIFDDVYRGLKPHNQRISASQYSSTSIIIESTTKRFGLGGLGATWTLVPDFINFEQSREDSNYQSIVALACDNLESNYACEILSSQIYRNKDAFVKGYLEHIGEPSFYSPFPGYPTLLFVFRPTQEMQSPQLSQQIYKTTGVRTVPGTILTKFEEPYDFTGIFENVDDEPEWVEDLAMGLTYVRFSLARVDEYTSNYVGRTLGRIVKENLY